MNSIGSVLCEFFEDHLKIQKGLSAASIKSYRDTLKLFLVWVAKTKHRHVTRLALADLTADQVLAFLHTTEAECSNQIRTRNQRLAALCSKVDSDHQLRFLSNPSVPFGYAQ